jgi:hypothetical protein
MEEHKLPQKAGKVSVGHDCTPADEQMLKHALQDVHHLPHASKHEVDACSIVHQRLFDCMHRHLRRATYELLLVVATMKM